MSGAIGRPTQQVVGWHRGLAALDWLPAHVRGVEQLSEGGASAFDGWLADLESDEEKRSDYAVKGAVDCLCSSSGCPSAPKQPSCTPSWLCTGAPGAPADPPLGLQLEQLEAGLVQLEQLEAGLGRTGRLSLIHI